MAILKAKKRPSQQKLLLINIDGWGLSADQASNLVNAETAPYLSSLLSTYPCAQITTNAQVLGGEGRMVTDRALGHQLVSSGQTVEAANSEEEFFKDKNLLEAIKQMKQDASECQVLVVLDNDGEWCLEYLRCCVELARRKKFKKMYVHVLLGSPQEGVAEFMGQAQDLVAGQDNVSLVNSGKEALLLDDSYDWAKTELVYKSLTEPRDQAVIKNDDLVIVVAKESKTIYQLAQALLAKDFNKFPRTLLRANYLSVRSSGAGLAMKTIGEEPQRENLEQVLSANNLKQVVVTEAYGALEAASYVEKKEDLLVMNSPLWSELNKELCQGAQSIAERSIDLVNHGEQDLLIADFVTLELAWQVGGSKLVLAKLGEFDELIAKLIKAALDKDYKILLSATCARSEAAIDQVSGEDKVQNSNGLVPLLVLAEGLEGHSLGHLELVTKASLLDVAPTILAHFGVAQPDAMVGKSLL